MASLHQIGISGSSYSSLLIFFSLKILKIKKKWNLIHVNKYLRNNFYFQEVKNNAKLRHKLNDNPYSEVFRPQEMKIRYTN